MWWGYDILDMEKTETCLLYYLYFCDCMQEPDKQQLSSLEKNGFKERSTGIQPNIVSGQPFFLEREHSGVPVMCFGRISFFFCKMLFN